MKHVLFIYAVEFEEIVPEIVIDTENYILHARTAYIHISILYTMFIYTIFGFVLFQRIGCLNESNQI